MTRGNLRQLKVTRSNPLPLEYLRVAFFLLKNTTKVATEFLMNEMLKIHSAYLVRYIRTAENGSLKLDTVRAEISNDTQEFGIQKKMRLKKLFLLFHVNLNQGGNKMAKVREDIFGTEEQQNEEFALRQKHFNLIYPNGIRGNKGVPHKLVVLRVIDKLAKLLEHNGVHDLEEKITL